MSLSSPKRSTHDMAGMLICFICWTICSAIYQESGNAGAGRAVIAFIWIFSVSYALAWSGLLVAYTVEIVPYKIRAKGLMVMNFWIQVALVINQYVCVPPRRDSLLMCNQIREPSRFQALESQLEAVHHLHRESCHPVLRLASSLSHLRCCSSRENECPLTTSYRTVLDRP